MTTNSPIHPSHTSANSLNALFRPPPPDYTLDIPNHLLTSPPLNTPNKNIFPVSHTPHIASDTTNQLIPSVDILTKKWNHLVDFIINWGNELKTSSFSTPLTNKNHLHLHI